LKRHRRASNIASTRHPLLISEGPGAASRSITSRTTPLRGCHDLVAARMSCRRPALSAPLRVAALVVSAPDRLVKKI
jgi:hypothetical protein